MDWRGTLKWKIDSRRCWSSFKENDACGLCILVCPWNKRDTWYHGFTATGVAWSGLFRQLALAVDDLFYWRDAKTNPRNNVKRPPPGPLNFATMLEMFGKERLDKNAS
jgi:ferredoxin